MGRPVDLAGREGLEVHGAQGVEGLSRAARVEEGLVELLAGVGTVELSLGLLQPPQVGGGPVLGVACRGEARFEVSFTRKASWPPLLVALKMPLPGSKSATSLK